MRAGAYFSRVKTKFTRHGLRNTNIASKKWVGNSAGTSVQKAEHTNKQRDALFRDMADFNHHESQPGSNDAHRDDGNDRPDGLAPDRGTPVLLG